ncbi:MAG: DUF6036 family nucleotidyltransferase [Balneolaceae bacterium]|nr:DUF6036 family nucleotidyltransferase [Balneolaceae bacterium]
MILKLLDRVSRKLEEAEIPYMLSGSLAMNIYTVPRMTRDIDLVIHMDRSHIERLASLFHTGYYIDPEVIASAVANEGMFNVVDHETGNKIDFIIRKSSDFHITEFDRRVRSSAFGFDVWVVTAEDLIVSKLKWIQDLESDTQKRDISNLLTRKDLDREYIDDWCNQLSLNTYGLLES